MSINRHYYVIAGYDLTKLKNDKFDDWRWTDDGEKWLCYQSNGNIQLFDDPMCGDYLYLGLILASGDEYDFRATSFDVIDVQNGFEDVSVSLAYLRTVGILDTDMWKLPEYKIIAFVEYR